MSFIGELKRRNVTRVAVFYLVAAWVVLQVAELLFDAIGVPGEWLRFIIVLMILGFPIALVFSWVYEVTPDGIKREKDIDPSRSITAHTGKRINVAIIALLITAIAFMAYDRLFPNAARPVAGVAEEVAAEAEPDERSIAVLPFADLSPDGDQEYFSDGISEEILNVLVRVEGLSVASRTTSFGFKGQESLGIPYMAEKMKVRHVLEGSVRKAGENVRITAQLIDAVNDKHLWSETYDRTLSAESIFEIQDDIANAIVESLGVIMDGTNAVRSRADTQDLGAYEAYLEANQLFVARTDLRRSVDLFEQAVAADPQFARAWAGLSAVAAVAPSWRINDRDYPTISDDAARRAIELDDSLALPYAVLGLNETKRMPVDFEESQANLEMAVQRNPKEASIYLWRGMNYMRIGHFDKALADYAECLRLDPQYELCRRHNANTLLIIGEFDESLEQYQQGLEKGFIGGDSGILQLLAARGDRRSYALAFAYFRNQRGEPGLVEFDMRAAFDPDYDFAAERARIEAAYRSAHGRPMDWSEHPSVPFRFRNYEELNDPTLPFWWYSYPDEWYSSEHPRRLIVALGLPAYWREHGFPPHCEPVGDNDFDCDIKRLHRKRTGGWVN